MTDMIGQYDVWTYDDGDEWLRRNVVPDMRLVYGVNLHRAETAAKLLGDRFPDATFEVRDVHGTVVSVYGAAREERARPAVPANRGRRTLGGRGR